MVFETVRKMASSKYRVNLGDCGIMLLNTPNMGQGARAKRDRRCLW